MKNIDASKVYELFNYFLHQCIIEHKSLFSNKTGLFTKEQLDEIERVYITQGIQGDETFDSKIEKQLKNIEYNPDQTKDVFAHIEWLWSLPITNKRGKYKKDIIRFGIDENKLDDLFIEDVGIGSFSNTQGKDMDYKYLIFLIKYLVNKDLRSIENINQEIEIFSLNYKADPLQNNLSRPVSRNFLLHLCNPDKYENTSSTYIQRLIIDAFKKKYLVKKDNELLIEEKLAKIRMGLSAELPNFTDFFDPEIRRIWDKNFPPVTIITKYWVFQAAVNKGYKIFEALNNNALNSWKVKENKKEIKIGDKVILRIGGEKSGIYALAEITSKTEQFKDIAPDAAYYDNPANNTVCDRVKLKLTHNLINNPIYKEKMTELKILGGTSGTNFRATKAQYDAILELIRNTKNTGIPNLILYGPPGTGKTYSTIDIASDIISNSQHKENLEYSEDEHTNNTIVFNKYLHKRIHFITFHQNYSYEEFVGGLRPIENAGNLQFSWQAGIFLKACAAAFEQTGIKIPNWNEKWSSEEKFLSFCEADFLEEYKDKFQQAQKVVLIIDEINRANISRVFGELITLIEDDKRIGGKHQLILSLPNGKKFGVPSNLVIIGTMNTADKSIALLDIALRRRFEFVSLSPRAKLVSEDHREKFEKLNRAIAISKSSEDYAIGHSYFMGKSELFHIENIMNNKIIPLLYEYFMGDRDEIEKILEAADFQLENANNNKQDTNKCYDLLRIKSVSNEISSN